MRRTVPDECDVLLRDGGIAHLRPLRADDREALHRLVESTSERSAFLRFFSGGRATAHAYVDRITGPGYAGRALVALMRGRLVAVAEYIPGPSGGDADVGILLDDSVHGHGLGTLLLEHLAVSAAASGVRELVADVLAENRTMIRVLRDLGLSVEQRYADGQMRIRVILEPTPTLLAALEAREHEAAVASLTPLLSPASVAVVGAGRDPGGIGHRVLRNLVDGGFPGPIYPVNPRADVLCGLKAHAKIGDVPGPVDLAVVATPARAVLGVARECAAAGVKGLVVMSGGFAEAGEPEREAALLRICRDAGMRLVGPDSLGVANAAARLNAGVLPGVPPRGRLGLMSQSGTLAVALIGRAAELGMGVSSFVSTGNKADVSGNDLLEYWEDDPETGVVALYLESFGNPRRFGRIARRLAARKPVIVLKSGRGGSGDRTVRSHTAAAATPDTAVDALLTAAGVIRVETARELLDTALLLTGAPLPAGPRVAIVGNSGGPEALTADACERGGLVVPELSEPTRARLRRDAGPAAAVANPVDLTGDAPAERIAAAVETVLADPGVDAVVVVYTPPFGSGREPTCRAIAEAARGAAKPVLVCVLGHDGPPIGGTPTYAFPEEAVLALSRVVDYVRRRERPAAAAGVAGVAEAGSWRRDQGASAIVRQELAEHPGGRWLDHHTASRLLACYGVHVAESIGVDGPESAAEAAGLTGLPAAVKATGPELVHRSDVGGVALGLATQSDVARAYREMAERVGPAMTGAIVQRMAEDGVEIIIGGVEHPSFGPLIMVGMGGLTAELLTDRAFRVPPVTRGDAAEMLRELRCYPLLCGYRGRPEVNVAALEEQIVRVARFLDEVPEAAELDLNPVMVTPRGAVAVDVRLRLAPLPAPPSPYRRRLR
ncbi:GNAT family N-acetyltransferase [Thermopolyspora sp. NPDC052614]|uniref:bifunctional acetate--CoA ligase family protein/GNAT family N-acetyltransferase n=1 Tax=Thermopolyspora sp. NPDC052614 TaxID=3155682 RepID=UPI003431B6F5